MNQMIVKLSTSKMFFEAVPRNMNIICLSKPPNNSVADRQTDSGEVILCVCLLKPALSTGHDVLTGKQEGETGCHYFCYSDLFSFFVGGGVKAVSFVFHLIFNSNQSLQSCSWVS